MSLKQNEADLVMAKKNADLAKINLDQLKSELDQFKSQERLDVKSQLAFKKRVSELEEALLVRDTSIKTLQEQLRQKQKEVETERNFHGSVSVTNRSLEAKVNEVN